MTCILNYLIFEETIKTCRWRLINQKLNFIQILYNKLLILLILINFIVCLLVISRLLIKEKKMLAH